MARREPTVTPAPADGPVRPEGDDPETCEGFTSQLRFRSMSVRSEQDGPGAAGAAGPAPGTPENPLQLTDARLMRGLAHPARLAILEHLVLDGPATATECADVAGLSPSACSYHLRALARYGLADEDPQSAADGRHRPWRAKFTAFS